MSEEQDRIPGVADEVADRLIQAIDDRMAAFEDRLQANLPDLRPFHAALAEIMDALAQQIEDGRDATASTRAALDQLRDRIEASHLDARHDGPEAAQDFTPVVDALAAIRDSLSAEVADTRERVERALDVLAEHGDARRANEDILRAVVEANRSDFATVVAALEDVPGRHAGEPPDLSTVHDALAAMQETLAGVEERLDAPAGDFGVVTAAIADLRTHLDDSRPDLRSVASAIDGLGAAIAAERVDLGPLHDAVAAVAARVDERAPELEPLRTELERVAGRVEHLAGTLDATVRAAAPDLEPVRIGIADLVRHVDAVGDALQAAIESNTVDLSPLASEIDAVRETVLTTRPDLSPFRTTLDEVLGALAQGITETRQNWDRTERAIAAIELSPDLGPVEARVDELRAQVEERLRAVDTLRDDLREAREEIAANRTDLGPLEHRLDGIESAIDAAVGRIESAANPDALDLGPLRDDLRAVSGDLGAAITAGRIDLEPLSDAVERLRLAVEEQAQATANDASGVRTVLTEVVTGLSETRDSIAPVGRAVESLETTLRDREPDLGPVLDALAALRSDIAAGRAETGGVARSLRAIADDLDELRRAEEAESPDPGADLRETEVRLAQRVDAAQEALRARIDDQRALTDNLAANVSQLNAALVQAAEEPQQLRRDLERILIELRQRLPAPPPADGS